MEKNITYTITIPQKNLSIIAPGLDIKDAAILIYLINLSGAKKIKWLKHNKLYYDFEKESGLPIRLFWCDFKTVGRKNPLLKIKSSSGIKQRILKLQKHGFLIRELHKKYLPIIYLADKSRLCWVKELPKECSNCMRRCESCSVFLSIDTS
jgi:hypothetical protein